MKRKKRKMKRKKRKMKRKERRMKTDDSWHEVLLVVGELQEEEETRQVGQQLSLACFQLLQSRQ